MSNKHLVESCWKLLQIITRTPYISSLLWLLKPVQMTFWEYVKHTFLHFQKPTWKRNMVEFNWNLIEYFGVLKFDYWKLVCKDLSKDKYILTLLTNVNVRRYDEGSTDITALISPLEIEVVKVIIIIFILIFLLK